MPIWPLLISQANFYNFHVVAFTLIPLVASAIFYGVNGEYPVPFIDALFLCYSSMTGTGLTTVNLSTLTGFQQSILFVLIWMGDKTVVSILMVLIRKHYFRTRCLDEVHKQPGLIARTLSMFPGPISAPIAMSRSMDVAPDGTVTKRISVPPNFDLNSGPVTASPAPITRELEADSSQSEDTKYNSGPGTANEHDDNGVQDMPSYEGNGASDSGHHSGNQFPQTITIQTSPSHDRPIVDSPMPQSLATPNRSSSHHHPSGHYGPHHYSHAAPSTNLLSYIFPKASRHLERKLTMPHITVYNSIQPNNAHHTVDDDNNNSKKNNHRKPSKLIHDVESGGWSKTVPWLSFDGLKVLRNSNFHIDSLTDEQLEQIGGTEYRALRFLGYFIPMYFIGTQLLSFLIFAPYLIATSRYDSVFEGQPRLVPKSWFSVFQVAASYTGTGMSLVDLGMVPFQTMYPMILAIMFVALSGQIALCLRFIIWATTKVVSKTTKLSETLHFLLEHPRRFPSHQTWFLLAVLVLFSFIEWASFWILDIGLAVTESLPPGVRFIVALFQGIAARATGYAIINVSALAPSVFIIMMYISVYPIAISIRSTNVYEEKSLGVFEAPPEDAEPEVQGTRTERVGKYINWHLRRQLANEVWWLVGAVWLICIIERDMLMDPENATWFNLFRIIFELVSAFSGIGLSLGIPTQNYSFAGALRKLSKLVVIAIMVRGRQRELPVNIDRAVMLPHEFKKRGVDPDNEKPRVPQGVPRRMTRLATL
ncbi:hypothetical protein BOTBODRAFT_34725 [Botryobasidium botryosum FD-172 SS1]|uniref:Potassium transport protein n=1 Tax=Botryobasidium botryosum (strain FD-172 SS1) TaxID=930990 RepID=A0A067MBN6_BOTB1|nr:hypothetical protein BOTBODRAFT_34725 [Botryobasidium botryosum FD-172 SS1]